MAEAIEEPKGTTLKNVDAFVIMPSGTTINTISAGRKVKLTRKMAIVQALESYSDAQKNDKFKAFDVGIRFEKANGQVSIDSVECTMIKLALEKAWPQPGIYVPLCRWLEGA